MKKPIKNGLSAVNFIRKEVRDSVSALGILKRGFQSIFNKDTVFVSVSFIVIAAMLSLNLGAKLSWAADTGFVTPSSTHTPNNFDVSTVASVQTSDNVYATDNDEDEQGYSNFSFPSIAAGSTINGIEVNAEAKSSDTSGCQLEVRLSWDNGTSNTSIKSQAVNGSDQLLVLGGSNDTWGHTWSVSELSNANFVAKVRFNDVSGNNCANNAIGSLDLLQAKVFYTTPTPPAANPSLVNACGFDIALVIDSSGSIDSTELTQMKTAFHGFVNAFSGTPTQFSVVDFDSTAHTPVLGFTANTTDVNNAIDAAASGGNTNWQDGLAKAQSAFDPRPSKPNLVVFASDGNPNRIGNPATTVTETQAVDAAVVVANSIKTTNNARILTLGVGNSLTTANLEAISSPDAVYTSGFDTLATTLSGLANQLCGGTITVNKVIDQDGNVQTTDDRTPATEGWTFNVAGSQKTTDSAGQTTPVEVVNGSYSVTEVSGPEGYSFLDASCVVANNNNASTGSLDFENHQVTGVTMGTDNIISCTFVNAAPKQETGTLIVNKTAIGGDGTFNFSGTGGISNFQIVTDKGGAGSKTLAGLTPGMYSVTEDQGTLPAGWAMTSNNCDDVEVLVNQTTECTIVNTYTAPKGSLVVNKVTVNGDGTFDFSGVGLDNFQITTTEGSGSQTINNLTAGSYTVNEGSLPTGWTQTVNTCVEVIVPAGDQASCTITNSFTSGGGGSNSFSVRGKVYNDNNTQNGSYDAENESGLADWTVYIDGNDNNQLDNDELHTQSDANGDYVISGLTAGCYTVREVLQGGWNQTEPTSVSDFEHKVAVGGGSCAPVLSMTEKIMGLFINTAHAAVALDANGLNFGNVQQSGGGGGGGSSGGGGGGGGVVLIPSNPTPPVPQVLGDSTTVPSTPTPQVLGAATELPRTGLPLGSIALIVITALAGATFVFKSSEKLSASK